MAEKHAEPGQEPAPATWWRGAWRGFNRWRRKYWLTRVIVLLLVFGPAVARRFDPRGPLFVRLVRIACYAIRTTGEPRAVYNLALYYKAEEARRLRLALQGELDADRDGSLSVEEEERSRAAGLDPDQLTCHILEADLTELGSAAKRLGLVPASYSTTRVRQHAWYAAQAEMDRMFAPAHQRIDALLAEGYQWPDYLRWQTWRTGIDNFLHELIWLFGLPLGALAWVLASLLVSGVVSLPFKRGRPLVGFLVGALLVLIPLLLFGHRPPWRHIAWLRCTGYALLTGTIGYAGGKAAARTTDRVRFALISLALLGLVIAGSGALIGLEVRLYYRWMGVDLAAHAEFGGPELPGAHPGAIAAGVALAAAAAFCLFARRRKPRAQGVDCTASTM
ncbi:MAG: hypothetical protein ACYTFZ_02490 [Planctomycetota bacterium]|jgi:hypothetical protein